MIHSLLSRILSLNKAGNLPMSIFFLQNQLCMGGIFIQIRGETIPQNTGYWVVGATGVRAGRSRALRCTPKLQRDYGYESRKRSAPEDRHPGF